MSFIGSVGLEFHNYVKWDAPGVEVIPPNEQKDIQAIADQINVM